jgi:hypothetical protein
VQTIEENVTILDNEYGENRKVDSSDGQVYTSSLVLLGSDFGIVIIMPKSLMIHTAWNPYLDNAERRE